MFETQLDEICLFPLQNKKNYFTFDDKKADEVKNFGRAQRAAERHARAGPSRASPPSRPARKILDFIGFFVIISERLFLVLQREQTDLVELCFKHL